MVEKALFIALVVFALFAITEVATEYHPMQLAADAVNLSSHKCQSLGWSAEAC